MLLYLTFLASLFVVRVLPLRVSYALARAGGALTYLAWRGGRRRCIDNMLRVAGGDARLARRYARRSFGNYGVYLVDFLRLTRMPAEEILEGVAFEDSAALHEHHADSGILFVTMHFGNWDLGAAMLAIRGFQISVIGDPLPNKRLDRLVLDSRERFGLTVIPADRVGPGVLRALRRNDIVGMLADVPQHEHGIQVEFFGAPVAVTDGPARIALRTGSTIVAASVPRLHPWSDRVAGEVELVAFEPTGETERDVRALTQALFATLERMIRRYPDQWYIFRHLWVADAARARAA